MATGTAGRPPQLSDTAPDHGLALRRAGEMAAVFMIGDGLLGLLQPTRHVDLWRSNVTAVDLLVRPFADHPTRRRWYGALQLAAGITLAAAMRPTRDGTLSHDGRRGKGRT